MARTVGEERGVYIVFGGYVCCPFFKKKKTSMLRHHISSFKVSPKI